jgi:hypothetical protein
MITVTITGPVATGKTTLARHLFEYLSDLGHNVTLDKSVGEGHAPLFVGARAITIVEHFTPREANNGDYCTGCSIPERAQVNLPCDWKEGDEIPPNTTLHKTKREPQPFAFIGAKHHQKRKYITLT